MRVSGAGLGCPDWPKCFGRWIPPLTAADLLPDINPATFNYALSWIEYMNRIAGMVLGIFIAATAVLAIVHYRRVKSILIPSIAAALLVAFQGWQGGQVVLSELLPQAVSFHLVIALFIVSLLIYVTQRATFLEEPLSASRTQYPASVRYSLIALWLLTFGQIILGAGVRGGIETLAQASPLANDHELIAMVGGIKYTHLMIGVVVAVLAFVIGIQIYRTTQTPDPPIRQSVWLLILLIALQMSLGTGLIAVGLPPLMQLSHLWIASLFLGIVLILYTHVKRAGEV